jgi:hypothetical protein
MIRSGHCHVAILGRTDRCNSTADSHADDARLVASEEHAPSRDVKQATPDGGTNEESPLADPASVLETVHGLHQYSRPDSRLCTLSPPFPTANLTDCGSSNCTHGSLATTRPVASARLRHKTRTSPAQPQTVENASMQNGPTHTPRPACDAEIHTSNSESGHWMLTSQRARSARTATFSAVQRPALNSTDTESKTCPPHCNWKEIEQSVLKFQVSN